VNKLFCLGVLLAGFGVCLGCGDQAATSSGDATTTDSPAYEQQMTDGTEPSTEVVEETVVEVTEEAAPAPEAPAAEAPAAKAPAAKAPAAEAPAAEAPAAEAPAAQ
jgi:hypothetical protein